MTPISDQIEYSSVRNEIVCQPEVIPVHKCRSVYENNYNIIGFSTEVAEKSRTVGLGKKDAARNSTSEANLNNKIKST